MVEKPKGGLFRSPQVVFVTGIRDIKDQPKMFMSVFDDAVRSIFRQTSPLFHLLVTCGHGESRYFSSNSDKISFVDAFPSGVSSYEGLPSTQDSYWEMVRLDKGLRLIRAIQAARAMNPAWIAIVDYDDLIKEDFIDNLIDWNPPFGLVQTEGIVFDRSSNSVYGIRNFDKWCGSCLVLKADLLDFPDQDVDAPASQILKLLGRQYIARLFGSHHFAGSFFRCTPSRCNMAAYHIGHGGNINVRSQYKMPIAHQLPESAIFPYYQLADQNRYWDLNHPDYGANLA